jgi:hypothetical protein
LGPTEQGSANCLPGLRIVATGGRDDAHVVAAQPGKEEAP